MTASPESMTRRNGFCRFAWVAGLAVIACVVFAYIFDAKTNLNGDNCYYYINATSLADGKGYSDMFGDATNNFPPGYPLLMTPLRMLTDSIVAQKIQNLIFLFIGTVLLFSTLVKAGFKHSLAFLTGAAVLVTPHLLEFSTMMMSEASCFCFTALAFRLYQSMPREDSRLWRSPLFYMFLASVVMVFYIRTQAIAVATAFFVAMLAARRWRGAAAIATATIIGYLPWAVRNHLLDLGQSRYLTQIDGTNIIGTLKMLVVQAIPESIIPFIDLKYNESPGLPLWIFAIVWLALIIYGFWNMGRLRYPMITLFVATLAIVSIIDTPSNYRYIIIIMPFLTAGLLTGLWILLARCARHINNRIKISPWVLLLLIIPTIMQINSKSKHSITGLHKIAAMKEHHPVYNNIFKIGHAVYKADRNAIVGTRKPELLYVNTKVRGRHFIETANEKEIIRDLCDKHIKYVILDQLAASYRFMYPCIKNNLDLFTPVMRLDNPTTYLFEFDREKALNRLIDK